jgi:hypothetical protein
MLQAVSQAEVAIRALLVHHVHTQLVAASVTATYALKGLSLTVAIQDVTVSNAFMLVHHSLLLPCLYLYTL